MHFTAGRNESLIRVETHQRRLFALLLFLLTLTEIAVHYIEHIIIFFDCQQASDVYVTATLLPPNASPSKEDTNYKTKVAKRSVAPVFDESFELAVPAAAAHTPLACILQLLVKHRIKAMFGSNSSRLLGRLCVPLSTLFGSGANTFDDWRDIEPGASQK